MNALNESNSVNPRLEETLRRGSAKATEVITRSVGNRLGIWYACGYPKSGTVWLAELLSAYHQIPYPKNYLLPALMTSVVHSHWPYTTKRDKCVYVVRDGRDVMVSYFFHFAAELQSGRSPGWTGERLKKLREMDPKFDISDPVGSLPTFIRLEMQQPRGIRINWPDHVSQWLDGRKNGNVALVKYEDLLADGPNTLAAAISALSGNDVDQARLERVFEFLSFENSTGRAQGTEDRTAFRRKATPGDWQNHFNDQAMAVFDEYCEEAMLKLGFDS